jgi:hypothetical protein
MERILKVERSFYVRAKGKLDEEVCSSESDVEIQKGDYSVLFLRNSEGTSLSWAKVSCELKVPLLSA